MVVGTSRQRARGADVGNRVLSWPEGSETPPMPQVLQFGGVQITVAASWVSVADRSVELSRRESALLHALATPPGRWSAEGNWCNGYGARPAGDDENALEVYISYLRRKLGQLGVRDLVRTVPGRGYHVAATGCGRTSGRAPEPGAVPIQLGGVQITLADAQVSVADRSAELNRRESALLHALATPPGLWSAEGNWCNGYGARPAGDDENALEVYISYLRRKLGHLGVRHVLRTVPGRGYQLADIPRGHPPTATWWDTRVLLLDGVPVTLAASRVSAAGRSVQLSGREAALLHALATSPGQLVSKQQLLTRVWGLASAMDITSVYSCVRYLRRKLDRIGARHLVCTVYGRGYHLAASTPNEPLASSTAPLATGDEKQGLPAPDTDITPTDPLGADHDASNS